MRYDLLRKLIRCLELAEKDKKLACHILQIIANIGTVVCLKDESEIPASLIVWADYFIEMNTKENQHHETGFIVKGL